MRTRRVAGAGAELAVYEYGRTPGPGVETVVLVHGYPDDHRVFEPVIRRLAATHHVVAYDTRNAGASTVAAECLASYRLPVLVDDLFEVLEAVRTGPGPERVHLVGHDWGSIQCWAAVQDPRAAACIAGYTSISGPDLGQFRSWIFSRVRRPRRWPELAGQLLRSWYVAAFQLPLLPEGAWRLFLRRGYEGSAGRSVGDDPIRGLALYRANMLARVPPLSHHCSVPVHVIVPVRDPFLSPKLTDGLETWVPRLKVTRVEAGHWWIAARPADCAAELRNWMEQVDREQRGTDLS